MSWHDIPIFDGETMRALEWLDIYSRLTNGWCIIQRTSILRSKLSGPAVIKWFNNLSYETFHDWDALTASFLDTFEHTKSDCRRAKKQAQKARKRAQVASESVDHSPPAGDSQQMTSNVDIAHHVLPTHPNVLRSVPPALTQTMPDVETLLALAQPAALDPALSQTMPNADTCSTSPSPSARLPHPVTPTFASRASPTPVVANIGPVCEAPQPRHLPVSPIHNTTQGVNGQTCTAIAGELATSMRSAREHESDGMRGAEERAKRVMENENEGCQGADAMRTKHADVVRAYSSAAGQIRAPPHYVASGTNAISARHYTNAAHQTNEPTRWLVARTPHLHAPTLTPRARQKRPHATLPLAQTPHLPASTPMQHAKRNPQHATQTLAWTRYHSRRMPTVHCRRSHHPGAQTRAQTLPHLETRRKVPQTWPARPHYPTAVTITQMRPRHHPAHPRRPTVFTIIRMSQRHCVVHTHAKNGAVRDRRRTRHHLRVHIASAKRAHAYHARDGTAMTPAPSNGTHLIPANLAVPRAVTRLSN
ncbi:hypothetical protein BU15DRAFT_78104 [Melanogaster broomeanus]|nr:hypothetical protein BU15DRAFT_78104 [Melanogaster broomeanus]